MKLTKIIASILALAAFVTVFAACSKKDDSADTTTVKLGVVGSIYEDLWQPAKDSLKEEGIDLEIVQFSDYVTPNNALNGGDIDLNAFQHHIYLDNELQQYGYDIELIGYTFIIPLNLYSNKVSSVDEIKDGDVAAFQSDATEKVFNETFGGYFIKVGWDQDLLADK